MYNSLTIIDLVANIVLSSAYHLIQLVLLKSYSRSLIFRTPQDPGHACRLAIYCVCLIHMFVYKDVKSFEMSVSYNWVHYKQDLPFLHV